MRSISIRLRIFLLICVVVSFAVGIGLAFYGKMLDLRERTISEVQQAMLSAQKDKLRAAVHTTALMLAEGLRELPDADAQAAYIRRMTRAIRFEADGSAYYFAYRGTVCLSLPVVPERQGKDLRDIADSNGVAYVRDLERQARDGGGFVEYVFPKTGKGEQPKLGFAEMIPGTDIWVGTGIYIDSINEKKESIAADVNRIVHRATGKIAVIVGLLFAGLVVPASLIIFKSIATPLGTIVQAAKAVAAGDLGVHLTVQGADEVSELEMALNGMVASLRHNMAEIKAKTLEAEEKAAAAEQASQAARQATTAVQSKADDLLQTGRRLTSVVNVVSAAADELSAQVEQSSRGSQLQAQRVSETAASMEEMNASVLEVAHNASQVAETSASARQRAEEGAQAVTQVVAVMEEINTNASRALTDMGALGKQAEGIGQILEVISDIADQTNLLALNAAIEAARAGEAGRGFAVVADEVRKLAEKTMAATREVGGAIRGIQDGTRQNYENVASAVAAIATATTLAGQSGRMLGEIVELVDATADQVRAIAAASEQQSATSEAINRSLSEVNSVSSENADGMRASARAVESLVDQAHVLSGLVRTLQDEGKHESETALPLLSGRALPAAPMLPALHS